MRRFLTLGVLLALIVAIAAFAQVKPGDAPVASAGPNGGQLIWGDWNCSGAQLQAAAPQGNNGPVDIEDVFDFMYFLAGIQRAVTGCPSIGDAVAFADFGTLFWGDINCDGEVDDIDALLFMLWYADLIPEGFPDCPDPEDVLDLLEGLADFKAEAMDYIIGGPVNQASVQDVEPQFFDVPYEVTAAFVLHNNGPDSPFPDIIWTLHLLTGGMFFRWMPEDGDICLDEDGNPIPCGEGFAVGVTTNGNGDDNCYDGIDNDDDGLIDFADPDCREIRGLRTDLNLVQTASDGYPASIAQEMQRRFNVRCLQAGPYGFQVASNVNVNTSYEDPEPGNNSASTEISPQTGGPPSCILTKSPAGGQERVVPAGRPVPYEPAALPNTGGRPD